MMRYLLGLVCVLALGVMGCSDSEGGDGSALSEAEESAIAALEAHMKARNERDPDGLAQPNNYPHVRFGGGDVRIWQTAEEFALWQTNVTFPFLDAEGWARSEWDAIDVIQSSSKKVHLAVTFSRYDGEGNRYLTAESLWIATEQNGHWGVQGRSSFVDEAQ